MSRPGLDFAGEIQQQRNHLSGSENHRRRGCPDPTQAREVGDRYRRGDQRERDESWTRSHREWRSRSPRDGESRYAKKSREDDVSPIHRHRSHRDDDKHTKREYSASRSPSPKRRRHDSEDRHRGSSHHHSHRHDDRHEKKEYSTSTSPPGRRRQHDSEERSKRSPHHHSHRKRSSPPPHPDLPNTIPPPFKRSHAPLPSQAAAYNQEPSSDAVVKPPPEFEKQKPNYAPTGKLAAETNTVANTSIVLKYNEPPEARLPPASSQWRLYVFKGKDVLETLPLHERSCWLFGRERAVVDFPTVHPSCSKQHAVLQFRYTEKKNEWGETKGAVKPYMIDLESANGTKVNGEAIPERRYVEVRSADVITFGESTREYVVLMPPKEEKKS